MARNEEKAQSLLNRWTSMKQDFADTFKNRRPYRASQCDNLKDAERWRRQIIREISKRCQISRMLARRHWERRIVQLGGPDYGRSQPQTYDADGATVSGARGYKYFGAAKDLPGVRELFQKEECEPRKRTRQDMYKHIEPDYYGFRDDEDEQQLKDEEEAEKRQRQRAMDGWDAAEAKRKAQVAELVRSPPQAVFLFAVAECLPTNVCLFRACI
ncbi:unnamed protein product [Peronospora destructor]|uniref:Pre-mRNA-splicing factor ISY1 n=1 Tax=Peronospora destructor TaxID=86335 RepID=A0AAV0TDC7_9STRA|nr:unnamed protein product [Peronospora destructor]